MTREEYREKLQMHDWFYAMSDDSRVYHRGQTSARVLVGLADMNPDLEEDYQAASNYMFSGSGFSIAQAPKPDWWKDR